jgi:glutamyl endopeptidase
MSCAQCAGKAREDFEGQFSFEEALESEVIGPDTRSLVRNTADAPFRYICNLEYDLPGVGRRSMCSGFLIGPRTVLTAGHCLANFDMTRMRVIPGRNGTLEPLPATRVNGRAILAPGYRKVSSADYGIIHLADPIGSKIGYWALKCQPNPGDLVGTSVFASGALPLPAGKLQVNLSGYPADMPSDAKSFCRDPRQPLARCHQSLLIDKRRSALCGTFQYRAYNRSVRLAGGIFHYLDDTCPGHSGSPVWVRRSPDMGGRVLVGIHIGGDGQANIGVFITPAVRKFIVANIL